MSTLIVSNIETQNAQVQNINGGQLAGMRNKIINGKMEIAQRGASFPAIAQGAYSLDRWADSSANTTSVVTYEQSTAVPISGEFSSSLRVTVTTADTSIAADDTRAVMQRIEGYNARDLIGRTFTLSFWVRSSKTGTHCVGLRNVGTVNADRSYVAEYTVSAANTWEFKTVTVVGGLITEGTWNWTNGVGLQVSFVLANGSARQTTPNAWQTGNFVSTSNQVNVLDTVGNIFGITGVQLEVGEVATPFEHRPYGAELALCQRYYQTGVFDIVVYQIGGSGFRSYTNFHAVMRATPTMATSGISYINSSGAGFVNTNVSGFAAGAASSSNGACGVSFIYTASAEL